MRRYSEDQPRQANGEWGSSGDGPRSGVVFHGTGAEHSLDPSHAATATGNPTAVWGTFFTPSEREAERYVHDFHDGKGVVMSARVSLTDPYHMSFAENEKFQKLDLGRPDLEGQMKELTEKAREFKAGLMKEGYDGIIIGRPGVSRPMEIVAFSSGQIEHQGTRAVDKLKGDVRRYSEDQPRAANGEWGEGSGDSRTPKEGERVTTEKGMKGTITGMKQGLAMVMLDESLSGRPVPYRPEALTPEKGSSYGKVTLPEIGGKTPQAPEPKEEVNSKAFPMASGKIDGRTVRDDIPNLGSVGASFDNGKYTVLPGVRTVSMKDFEGVGVDKSARTQALAAQIKESKSINPLIVAVDSKGPYILEGGHRFSALQILGAKAFPAMIVLESDAPAKWHDSPSGTVKRADEGDPTSTVRDHRDSHTNGYAAALGALAISLREGKISRHEYTTQAHDLYTTRIKGAAQAIASHYGVEVDNHLERTPQGRLMAQRAELGYHALGQRATTPYADGKMASNSQLQSGATSASGPFWAATHIIEAAAFAMSNSGIPSHDSGKGGEPKLIGTWHCVAPGGDEASCEHCPELDEESWPIDEIPEWPGDGQQDCFGNCVPAETLVGGPTVQRAFRYWYEGPMYTVHTAGGKKLTGTPNHPVLTLRGWVPLQGLVEGDYLLCNSGEVSDLTGRNPNEQGVKPTIGEVYNALEAVVPEGGRRQRVMGLMLNFHGDIPQGDVDILTADGSLLSDDVSEGGDLRGQVLFPSAYELQVFLMGLGSLQGGGEAFPSPTGLMTGSGPNPSLLGGSLSHTQEHGGASVSHDQGSLVKPILNGLSGHTRLPLNSEGASPFLIETDNVVDIGLTVDFAGHVFSLETVSGWYLSNGIISQNCRCSIEFNASGGTNES